MNNKRGISTVVATVLMIVITVAAVGIIWAAVVPMITNKLSSSTSCIDAGSQVQLMTDQGYPCKNTSSLKIQIKRGPKDLDLSGVQVLVSIKGNSYSYDYSDDMPGPNEERLFSLSDSQLNLPSGISISNASEVKIAPMVTVGSGKETCDASPSATIKTC